MENHYFSIGESSINHQVSIAMVVSRRVTTKMVLLIVVVVAAFWGLLGMILHVKGSLRYHFYPNPETAFFVFDIT